MSEAKNPSVPNARANVSNPDEAARTSQSSLPSVRITERRKVHDLMAMDPASVEDGRHYRLVRRDNLAITKAKMRGYRMEPLREGGPRLLGEFDQAGDGSQNIGDTVLMSCDEEEYQRGRQEIERVNESRLDAVDRNAKEKIREVGFIDGKQAITVITNRE